MDETNPVTLESGDPRRQHEHDKSKQSIRSLFEDANLCAAVRCFFSFPMLASAIYILATYPRPAPNPAVVSFASYSLGCAISHIISLVTHRITRPPSPTSALPLRGYIVGLVVSPVLLSVAVVFGLVVVALTKGYHGQHHHQPFKVEVVAFDLTIVCVSFAFAALCCSLRQCYCIYCLSQNEYAAEEIQEAIRSASTLTCRSMVKDILGGWHQRARGSEVATKHNK